MNRCCECNSIKQNESDLVKSKDGLFCLKCYRDKMLKIGKWKKRGLDE